MLLNMKNIWCAARFSLSEAEVLAIGVGHNDVVKAIEQTKKSGHESIVLSAAHVAMVAREENFTSTVRNLRPVGLLVSRNAKSII